MKIACMLFVFSRLEQEQAKERDFDLRAEEEKCAHAVNEVGHLKIVPNCCKHTCAN